MANFECRPRAQQVPGQSGFLENPFWLGMLCPRLKSIFSTFLRSYLDFVKKRLDSLFVFVALVFSIVF